jgi:8-oxo-dGTP pyrophosphatase MutT (NUDIX family)
VQRLTAPPEGTRAREAAVLALFYPKRSHLTLLLIQRPEYPGHHSGQIGLPGGSIEPADASPLHAALREAREEVGLNGSDVQVLGDLDPIYVQVSNFMVQPYVAWSPTRPRFRPDPVEVAGIVEAPLAALLDPAGLQEEERLLGDGWQIVPYFRVGRHRVWGATARILDQFLWRVQHHLNPHGPGSDSRS